MELWHAAILGLVEGITEYLPISSTGHLIITASLLGLDTPDQKSSVDAFNIVIQGGAILAVLGLYRRRVWQMGRGLMGKDPAGLRLAINILIAFLPAAVLGFLLNDWIESRLFSLWPVAAALALGGVFMILVDRWRMKHLRDEEQSAAERGEEPHAELDLADLTPARALIIGLLQVLAIWPGTSRSMMTITGGVLVGLRPKQAAEFSFLLGLPTLGGATVYSFVKNLRHAHETGTPNMIDQLGVFPIVLGIAVATLSAMIAVRWLVGFLNKHGLTPFGVYRLGLCALLLGLALGGVISMP